MQNAERSSDSKENTSQSLEAVHLRAGECRVLPGQRWTSKILTIDVDLSLSGRQRNVSFCLRRLFELFGRGYGLAAIQEIRLLLAERYLKRLGVIKLLMA